MITIENLTKKYGDFTAIEHISCTIKEGSIYGLVGYNGAGKTTLIKTIAGIYRPEKGRVLADGKDIYDNEEYRSRLFIIPDEPYFIPQASLDSMRWFYKGYYPGWNDHTYKKLAEIFRLDTKAKIDGFSKGMQRQASILLALSTLPKYLLLDESFDGLDLSKRNLLKKLLRKYAEVKKAIVLISSHNLRELEGIVDNIGIIRDKVLSFDSPVSDINEKCGKYRVEFDGEFSGDDLKGIGIRSLQADGNIFTFIADGRRGEIEERIRKFKPKSVEVLPVTLEEFFIEEREEQEYDFSTIF